MMQTITNHKTTEAGIAAELRRLGFVEGAPPHIAPALVDADIRIYNHLACPSCRKRGMRVQPYHRGREYRLVCSCRKCGAEQEA